MTDKNKYGETYSAAYEDVTACRVDLEGGPDAYTLILPETLDWSADRTDQIVDRFDLIAEEIARQIKGVGRRLEGAIKQQEEPMNELNPGEVITIEDGVLKVSTYLGATGRQEYELEFPVTHFNAWTHADTSAVRLTIDSIMARRLARLINDHMGETNE